MTFKTLSHKQFLKDVFLCSLASYGGPEAHYGVFAHQLIQKRSYITEEELSELIGLFSIVPGPSSTQTITAIGYHLGGKKLALLTFLIWIGPAVLMMSTLGLFFHFFKGNHLWQNLVTYLPAAAIAFIIYAAINLTRKVVIDLRSLAFFLIMGILAFLTIDISVWMVFLLLMLGGILRSLPYWRQGIVKGQGLHFKWRQAGWKYVWLIALFAIIFQLLDQWHQPLLSLFASMYRYGYSVIGGGQVIIPLMIQDLVKSQHLITQSDFLTGYAFDQAVPGPLFSFAAFVAARSFADASFGLLIGILGGLMIFLPGTLLVFFMTPLWQHFRKLSYIKYFLNGVTLTVAALITLTAITQLTSLPLNLISAIVVLITTLTLLSKKVPAPLIIVLVMLLGLVI